MRRTISGVAAGTVIWMVLVSLINFVPRYSWPAYAAAEPTYDFTLGMMIMRLSMSAISSVVAGYVAAMVEHDVKGGWISGLLIALLFLPDHISRWAQFPIWYHLTFLISLPLLGWVGSRLRRAALAPVVT